MKNLLTWALCLFVLFMISCKAEKPADVSVDVATAKDTTVTVAPAEFADPRYSEIVKTTMAAFERGDVSGMLANYADNAVYLWNNGDSLVGKPAIHEYWTKRMAEVIDSLNFENQIYLPVQVNTPQSVEQPGVWVLAWYQTTAKYKNGKSMTQWIHSDTHFDANGKIDRVIQYMDRALVNAATAK